MVEAVVAPNSEPEVDRTLPRVAASPISAESPISTAKICNVTDFGAVADNFTNIGPAISSAFTKCVQNSPQPTFLLPPGTYALKLPVAVDGSNWTFRWQGNVIVPFNSSLHGNMVTCNAPNNWTFNGEGCIVDGQGHLWRTQGPFFPRLVQISNGSDFKFHGLTLLDSLMFHLDVVQGQRGEIFNITIEGAQIGATHGIDLSVIDMHVHHVRVTNRDECVTVKTPSNGILIEDVTCYFAGATSQFGSYGGVTAVENVLIPRITGVFGTRLERDIVLMRLVLVGSANFTTKWFNGNPVPIPTDDPFTGSFTR
ncbi:pectin lyase fold/virulence factor [Blyttiomyces helicus]|uniref:Pectin lyase fold/virulence factor n=1 Tax=Blyttiomyces helicus TaxID=388810 RepID=A0A4P9WIB2_9FUNG|nr:pectin lyase fold/virulence factor [Blyttiomyces helicus]|eukprot:RKO90860.1 pectin lyase fold/virulence factor [Blyttiomyces helicus]